MGLGWHQQQPNQLAPFLVWIYEHREEINNYTEIGVAYGGTFYIIDSYLRAINPMYKGGIAVDIIPRLLEAYNYTAKFTDVQVIQSNSLTYIPDTPIDLCLVDTNHTYDWVMQEYEHYKQYCKYIAFHDINAEGFPEMKKFWKEMKSKHQHWEFVQQYSNKESMGIGVIKI